MTIKIDAKKGYNIFWNSGNPDKPFEFSLPGPCRIVRDSDWRKVMAVVRAAEIHSCCADSAPYCYHPICSALATLRKLMEKRK